MARFRIYAGINAPVKIDKSHETVLILVRVKALSGSLSNRHFIRIVFWQSDYRIAAGSFSDDCKHFDLKKDYYLFSSFFFALEAIGTFYGPI